jgi:hypothetical protein
VPKVAIDENGEPTSPECKIGCAEDLPVIPPESQADRLQRQMSNMSAINSGPNGSDYHLVGICMPAALSQASLRPRAMGGR